MYTEAKWRILNNVAGDVAQIPERSEMHAAGANAAAISIFKHNMDLYREFFESCNILKKAILKAVGEFI